MAGIVMIEPDDVAPSDVYADLGHEVAGALTGRHLGPPGYPLWLTVSDLADGTVIRWPEARGDEAVYVRSGALAVEGRTCPPSGAVVVERGATTAVVALGRTQIVHFGPSSPTPADAGHRGGGADGGRVHVVGPRGTFAAVTAERDTHYYADSTCPTCRITLLYTSRSVPYVSPTHSHSVDELIHVVGGELWLGRRRLGPGSTLAVEADRRYAFRSGPDGFAFLNYRADASAQTVERGSPPLPEGGRVNGLEPVMDLL